jgi:glycosyltransferase involved in cell wall biosynthesis
MQPLKIAQICSSSSWGGMEMHVTQLSTDLIDRGHHCIVFCSPNSPLYKDAIERGIEIRTFAPTGYFSPHSILSLARHLVAEKIDIVHAHYSRDLWSIVPALKNIPLVFIKHIGTQKAKRDPFHKWIYSRVCKMIAISKVIADNLIATHPVSPDKIEVLHHGIDVPNYDSALQQRAQTRSRLGFDECHFVIGNIGRLQVGKGHLEFIEMAKQIHKAYPYTRFMVVGEPTKGEEFRARVIYDALEQSGLRNVFVMTGYRKDVPNLLAAMDCFVFPSRAEAFGLVVIEAMAAGLPVVACKSDGILDIIEDERQGLLVPPQNSLALAKAVAFLVENEEKRHYYAIQAREHVEKYFSRTRMLERLETFYKECLQKSKSSHFMP